MHTDTMVDILRLENGSLSDLNISEITRSFRNMIRLKLVTALCKVNNCHSNGINIMYFYDESICNFIIRKINTCDNDGGKKKTLTDRIILQSSSTSPLFIY